MRHRIAGPAAPRHRRGSTPGTVELLVVVLLTLVVLPWGLFARTQRDLLRSSHERALRLEAEQRARVEQARCGSCAR